MAYRSGHYDFVIDSSFQPFSMQEMLAPLTLYKEAFEKSEEAYADLKTKADVFKDLSESLPENSKAKQIYEGYANDLNSQAEDLARNGLNMGNRRALTSLKQRYSGEIGELDRAKTKLEEVLKTRSALEASGKRRYYATNNPTIDDFLGGNTPNMYSIDSDVLYAKGAQRGKAISSRMYDTREGGSAINGYLRNIMDTRGMSPQQLAFFMQSKEFNDMVDLAMIEEGVAGNLTGMDYARAKQNYVSGMFDSVIYEEKNNWQRDPDRLDPKEKHSIAMDNARFALSQRSQALQEAKFRREMEEDDIRRELLYERDPQTGKLRYREGMEPAGYKRDPITGKLVRDYSQSGSGGSGSSSGSDYKTQGTNRVVLKWESGDPNKDEKYRNFDNISVEDIPDDEPSHVGKFISYDRLPEWAKEAARVRIGNGNANMYDYYFEDYHGNWPLNKHAKLEMVPRGIKKYGATNLAVLDDDSELE